MGESMLNREFRERDLQRMRNLVSKNFNDKTVTQIGYKKVEKEYKEGDIWEEDNKKYTIKNGIKITLSKLDNVRKLFQVPICCEKCNKPMKNKLDKKMWFIHKMCFDCVLEYESNLKLTGKYEEYENRMINFGIKEYIKDLEYIFNDFINESNNVVTENGDIEEWGNNGNEKIKEEVKKYLDNLKNVYST